MSGDKKAVPANGANASSGADALGGLPGGMPGNPFDFGAMSSILSDPSIKEMAASIAQDPAFEQITRQLQANLGGASGRSGPEPAIPQIDPSAYMSAMQSVMQNPQFLQMAESLGTKLLQDPQMSGLLQQMQNPDFKTDMQEKMNKLKEDPELKPVIEEIESGGPSAMMKYWNDPEVLAKIGKVMGGAPLSALVPNEAAKESEETEEFEEEEEEEDGEPTVLSCAKNGELDELKKLLAGGADPNEKDSEGRTGLHFSAGYGEKECAEALLDKGANPDALDKNNNTPLHYSAGYGREDLVKLLIDSAANVTLRNLDGKTAQDVAELNKQEGVVKLLAKGAFI